MKKKAIKTDRWQFKNQGLLCNTFLYTDIIPNTSLKCEICRRCEKAVKCWGDTAGYSSFSPESNFPLVVRCNFVLLRWMQSRGRNLFYLSAAHSLCWACMWSDRSHPAVKSAGRADLRRRAAGGRSEVFRSCWELTQLFWRLHCSVGEPLYEVRSFGCLLMHISNQPITM